MRINEAKKPSNVDLKSNSRKVVNQYITGDIYDFHSPMESKEDTYVDHEGNGYIMDKTGREYPVSASISQGDSGRIAGGATNYYVTIYFPGIVGTDGKEAYYSVEGYTAIFSNGSNTGCVSDLQNGYYLEDYIAKYNSWRHNLPQELYDELIARADANATSYTTQRRAAAEKRNAKKDAEINDKYDFSYFEKEGSFPRFLFEIKNGTWVSYNNDTPQAVTEFLIREDVVCGRPLSDFEGLKVELTLNGDKIGVDKTTGELVNLTSKKNKYGGLNWSVGKPRLFNLLRLNVNDTPYAKAVCKYYKTHKEEFEGQDLVYHYTNMYTSKSGVFEAVKDNYKILEREYDTRDWLTNGNSYLKNFYVEGSVLKRVCELFPQSLQELKSLNRRAADFNVNRGFKGYTNASEAETKMIAWHNGERKQNVRSCSDAKLQAYYKICKRLGYEDEANKLKAEADSRGITLTESRRRNEAWKYTSGRVPNEGNGRVGGSWYAAHNNKEYEKEVEVEYNSEYYLVYLSVYAELSYGSDESTDWSDYDIDIDEDSISLIDIQREDPERRDVANPQTRDILFDLAKTKLITEKDKFFEDDWIDDADY